MTRYAGQYRGGEDANAAFIGKEPFAGVPVKRGGQAGADSKHLPHHELKIILTAPKIIAGGLHSQDVLYDRELCV